MKRLKNKQKRARRKPSVKRRTIATFETSLAFDEQNFPDTGPAAGPQNSTGFYSAQVTHTRISYMGTSSTPIVMRVAASDTCTCTPGSRAVCGKWFSTQHRKLLHNHLQPESAKYDGHIVQRSIGLQHQTVQLDGWSQLTNADSKEKINKKIKRNVKFTLINGNCSSRRANSSCGTPQIHRTRQINSTRTYWCQLGHASIESASEGAENCIKSTPCSMRSDFALTKAEFDAMHVTVEERDRPRQTISGLQIHLLR